MIVAFVKGLVEGLERELKLGVDLEALPSHLEAQEAQEVADQELLGGLEVPEDLAAEQKVLQAVLVDLEV